MTQDAWYGRNAQAGKEDKSLLQPGDVHDKRFKVRIPVQIGVDGRLTILGSCREVGLNYLLVDLPLKLPTGTRRVSIRFARHRDEDRSASFKARVLGIQNQTIALRIDWLASLHEGV